MPGYNNKRTPEEKQPHKENASVSFEDVSKSFGSIKAVSELSIQIDQANIFGLLGSDGAGKSTLLRMAATMIRPTSGRILIHGLDTVTQKSKVKHLIGYMPQRFGLYQDLTVGENLDFFMDIFGIFGMERKKRTERYLGFSNLLPFIDRPAGKLSGGMKQKLGLACVLAHEPKVLILDEPTNGVDPVSRQEFWDILLKMKKDGMTVLISTAYLDEGEKCDSLAILHNSQLLDVAGPSEIRSDFPDLEEAVIHRINRVDERLANDNFQL